MLFPGHFQTEGQDSVHTETTCIFFRANDLKSNTAGKISSCAVHFSGPVNKKVRTTLGIILWAFSGS